MIWEKSGIFGLARRRRTKPVGAVIKSRIRDMHAKGMGKLKIARELEIGTSVVQRVLAETAAT